MSGLWGPQSALDLYLQEQGISTLLFAGVNADQVRLSDETLLQKLINGICAPAVYSVCSVRS